ncbi:hypothetical protein [Stenotrophomonas sp. B1-1]|uniref:hypothetical protein n=1 Tax=Stenotrophomonas sp. B1-1 TaxID=2710648 RepID=UPI0013DAF0B0|nr:hypothetical protein [Stenotrophomonas sp. B1-1]
MHFFPIDPAAVSLQPAIAEGQAVPLSDRFKRHAASAYLEAGVDRAVIEGMANDPVTASNPALLWELQQRQEAYTKRMTLAAVMTNHLVKGVETLVKT